MKVENINNINTAALAYMGDAVYEQAVRENLIKRGIYDTNRLHREATSFVSAFAQAGIIKEMFDELDEREKALVKRARNRKTSTKAKNADIVTYKWATAFEALVGYLYLTEQNERLIWVIDSAVKIAGGRDGKQKKEKSKK